MGTRSKDHDPSLQSYLAKTEDMTIDRFHQMLNTPFGWLGVSETSSDLCDLLACEFEIGRMAYVKQFLRNKRLEHFRYVAEHGEAMPEIHNWK